MSAVLIVIKEDADREAFVEALKNSGMEWSGFSALRRHFRVEDTTPEAFPLKDHPAILAVEANRQGAYRADRDIVVDNGYSGANWGLARHTHRDNPFAAPGARFPLESEFNCARTGQGVDVYILDSGFDYNHPELVGKGLTIFENQPSDADGDNDIGHGTGTSSAIVGATTGIAPDARFYMCKVLHNQQASDSAMLGGFNAALYDYNLRAATKRPAVISVSITSTLAVTYVQAINDCIAAGMIVCYSAGNDRAHLGDISGSPPFRQPGVVCCGGIRIDDAPYNTGQSGTNYGTEVDILACGQHVFLARRRSLGTDYAVWNGTSFSAPTVAGALACILQDYERPDSRSKVQNLNEYLYEEATKGRYKPYPPQSPMTDAILYLEPSSEYPAVPTLVPGGPFPDWTPLAEDTAAQDAKFADVMLLAPLSSDLTDLSSHALAAVQRDATKNSFADGMLVIQPGGAVRFGSASDFTVSGDFCLEFDISMTDPTTTTTAYDIVSLYRRDTNERSLAVCASSNVMYFYTSVDGTNVDSNPTFGMLRKNVRTRICYERTGNTTRLYRDGRMMAKFSTIGTLKAPTLPLSLGEAIPYDTATAFSQFSIANVRFTKASRYNNDGGYIPRSTAFPTS